MKRVVVSCLAAASVAVLSSACNDEGPHRHRHHWARPEACTMQPSCGECTPVLGCGWCFTTTGGVCVSDPDACPRGATGFTWDPPGCGEAALLDAGARDANAPDAPAAHTLADAQVSDAQASDAQPR